MAKRTKAKRNTKRTYKPRKKSITITCDGAIFAEAEKTLTERGTTIKTWLTLQLHAITKVAKPVVTLTDKMSFGKYYGAIVEDVVRGDPGYCKWMLSAEGVSERFHADVFSLAEELAR